MKRTGRFLAAVGVLLILLIGLWLGLRHLVCVPPGALAGFWAWPSGELVEVVAAPEGMRVSSASGIYGSEPGKTYPFLRTGCRSYQAVFPFSTLYGQVALDHRQVHWDKGPLWVRQGLYHRY
jgi:hypothetical protein